MIEVIILKHLCHKSSNRRINKRVPYHRHQVYDQIILISTTKIVTSSATTQQFHKLQVVLVSDNSILIWTQNTKTESTKRSIYLKTSHPPFSPLQKNK